jgi:hypothetical protein
MGQMVYDNLFMNRTIKDLLMGTIRSLGWNLGTFRLLGGGIRDFGKAAWEGVHGRKPEFTQRMGYTLALPLVVGFLGAALMKLLTGKDPAELKDYFFPQVGGKDANGNPQRISLPSYMKDVYAYTQNPLMTLQHKLHPGLSMIADMLENKDYYGVAIRNEDDPVIKQALEELEYVGKQFEPFSSRGVRQLAKSGASPGKTLLPLIGVVPAPADINRTPAERLAEKINNASEPAAPISQQEEDRRLAKSSLVRDLRRNDQPAAMRDIWHDHLSVRDISAARKRAASTPLQNAVRHMTLEQAQRVYAVANAKERQELAGLIAEKRARESELPAFTF